MPFKLKVQNSGPSAAFSIFKTDLLQHAAGKSPGTLDTVDNGPKKTKRMK